MKGYWHFPALAAACSFFTFHFQNYMILIIFLLWLFFLYYYYQLGKSPIIISLVFFLFFSIYTPEMDTITSSDHASESTAFTGKIIRPVFVTEKKVEVLLQDQTAETKLSVVFFPDEEVTLPSPLDYPSLKHGALCNVSGKTEIPPEARNPGQFDVQNYLLQQGISKQLVLSSQDDITCEGASFFHRIHFLRAKLTKHIKQTFSNETGSWLNALVFGDDSLLEEDVITLFQGWGLSHILAISGLHIGIVVALIYFMLLKLNITTKEKAEWIMIFFLPFYALLAGGAPSVLRASTMVLLFVVLRKIKWHISITDALSIVFLLLMIFDPFIIFHVGFQLSFIVTSGIILSRHWINQSETRLMQVFKISFVSQMMIIPLQFTYFSSFQPLSILLNVIAVPYFSLFIIPFMFILLLFAFLPAVITGLFDGLFAWIQQHFLNLLEIADKYADFPIILGEMPLTYSAAYYVLFFLLMFKMEQGKLNSAFRYGVSISFLIIYLTVRPYFSPIGTVTMLDIGQGDAFIIELPYRNGVIFMDAGASFSFEDFLPTEKVYRQIIKPYLYSRGISKIDAVFLSHEDIDHVGSVPYMLEDMEVEEIFISEYYDLDIETAAQWSEHGTRIKRVSSGEGVNVNGQFIEAIAPVKDLHSPNENSLVLFTEFGGKSWLFTGDIGVEAERKIIKARPDLSADILKVGHHGSSTSTDEAFVKQIDPNYALISVGRNNSYGHPAKEVLETLQSENVHILRTDKHGAVQFHFKKGQGTFTNYLP